MLTISQFVDFEYVSILCEIYCVSPIVLSAQKKIMWYLLQNMFLYVILKQIQHYRKESKKLVAIILFPIGVRLNIPRNKNIKCVRVLQADWLEFDTVVNPEWHYEP